MENYHYKDNIKDKRILFFLLFLPCVFIRRVLDNDTWFLLNSGRYVMEHGIPNIEPFSIHENLKFVLQQWLTDVIFWNVYDNFGENGLYLIVFLCYVAIIFLMYRLTMKVSKGNTIVSFTVTLLASILIFTYMVARPTIFTLVIVMIELNLLEGYVETRNSRYLIFLPVLSLLQINLHAALWPILFVLILPYVVDSFNFKVAMIQSEGYGVKYLTLAVVLMAAAAFINPYGIDAITYLINSTGHLDMNNIVEIMHPYVNSFLGALIFAYISIIALTYVLYRKGQTKARYILMTLGTMYMVLSSIRNMTYFAICSLFPISFYLKDFSLKEKNINVSRTQHAMRYVLIALIIMITCYYNFIFTKNNNTYTEYFDLNNTIEYIFDNEDVSNVILYTGFNEGALVQFKGLPSYIDPRAEVYFTEHNKREDIFDEYFDMQKGRVYYKLVLDKYDFTHLIVAQNDILYSYLSYDNDYKLAYSNDRYRLFIKK